MKGTYNVLEGDCVRWTAITTESLPLDVVLAEEIPAGRSSSKSVFESMTARTDVSQSANRYRTDTGHYDHGCGFEPVEDHAPKYQPVVSVRADGLDHPRPHESSLSGMTPTEERAGPEE
jgi:hypothetical protein